MDHRQIDYLERRARQEHAMADVAPSPEVAAVHRTIAAHYAERTAATRTAQQPSDATCH